MPKTAGEIQAYIKAGAILTAQGFAWHKRPKIAERQIETFAFIRGLQAQNRYLLGLVSIL